MDSQHLRVLLEVVVITVSLETSGCRIMSTDGGVKRSPRYKFPIGLN